MEEGPSSLQNLPCLLHSISPRPIKLGPLHRWAFSSKTHADMFNAYSAGPHNLLICPLLRYVVWNLVGSLDTVVSHVKPVLGTLVARCRTPTETENILL